MLAPQQGHHHRCGLYSLSQLAPVGAAHLGGLPSRSTADGRVIYSYLKRLRPERRNARGEHIRWGNPDVYVPAVAGLSRGLPVFLDVRVVRGDSSKRAAANTPVVDTLREAARHKTQHYETECGPGGPLHHACLMIIPFMVDAGGRLGEEADALLRSWARLAAGDDLKCESISDQASSIDNLRPRQYREVDQVGAVLRLRMVGETGIIIRLTRAAGHLELSSASSSPPLDPDFRPQGLGRARGHGHMTAACTLY